MSENRLSRETSPYLLQHKDNPVHWRAWGPEALAEAVAADKPILLSVGYAACHWCHVMAHECFETPAIADLMNELFVPIKVDREERPDIDQIYQHALALLGQQGGWPLTMFLTPAAEPFWGGTYFPPEARWGRAGFPDVLRGVAAVYRTDKDRVGNNVGALGRGLAKLAQPAAAGPVDPAVLDQIAQRFTNAFDKVNGGLGGAPKFPNCSILELVWRGWKRTGTPAMRDSVLTALDHMSQGGIYDHVGGGYARYSTDERWLAPHFEKMLYDNAQLLDLLTWAWQETGNPLYRMRAEETVGWLLREMRAEGGAFAATLDADSEHEEGKFYVWTAAEIDRALGSDAMLFKDIYDVTPGGNWEGKTILNRLHRPLLADDATEAMLAANRRTLLKLREDRIRPGRDDKVLADWNGLMIAALVGAAPVFGRPDWLVAASEAYGFVTSVMMPAGGRLFHSWRLGRAHPGTLDDHAAMARAALALYEATGEIRYLDQAKAWVRVLDTHFADPAGGYFLTADDTEALITRTKSVTDAAVPSGNGVALQVLVRLAALTGDQTYSTKAESLIAGFSGELDKDFFSLAAYLNGIDFHAHPLQIVVAGHRHAEDAKAMLAAVNAVALPNRVLQFVEPGESLPLDHPAHGKGPIDGRAAAYICEAQTCSLPITQPDQLLAQLKGR